MALPCARRPPEVEEEDVPDNGGTSEISSLLKKKVNLKEIFMESMVSWYENLYRNRLEKLTRKEVIYKALTVCKDLQLPYYRLPGTWLRTLHFKHGIEFKLTKRIRKKKVLKEFEKEPQVNHGSQNSDVVLKKEVKFDKTFVDLTDEPPPKEWIVKCLKNKYVAPRQLKVSKTPDGVTVLYYDYSSYSSMKPENGGERCKPTQPHDRMGIFLQKSPSIL